ncbi:MAG: hypothetical protein GY820_46415 [Gammaproteobacteria bacterium]|nr:hypothetical protein [Gammaproteobacteria bacterium]
MEILTKRSSQRIKDLQKAAERKSSGSPHESKVEQILNHRYNTDKITGRQVSN